MAAAMHTFKVRGVRHSDFVACFAADDEAKVLIDELQQLLPVQLRGRARDRVSVIVTCL